MEPGRGCNFIPGRRDDVLVVIFGNDEILPALHGEYNVNIKLRVGVCHARKMPLLTELENFFRLGFYK